MEMRRLLTAPYRARGVRLLVQTGLAEALWPELVPRNPTELAAFDKNLAVLSRLVEPSFPVALAALLNRRVGPSGVRAVGARWRLANREIQRATWLVQDLPFLQRAHKARFSELQPVLIHDGIDELLALGEAVEPGSPAVAHCRAALRRPPEELDPPPLVDGAALIAHGIRPGPKFGRLLDRARRAQLDGEVTTQDEALALIDREIAASDP